MMNILPTKFALWLAFGMLLNLKGASAQNFDEMTQDELSIAIQELTPEDDEEIRALTLDKVERRLALGELALKKLIENSDTLKELEVTKKSIEDNEATLDKEYAAILQNQKLSIGELSEALKTNKLSRRLFADLKVQQVLGVEVTLKGDPDFELKVQLESRISADKTTIKLIQSRG